LAEQEKVTRRRAASGIITVRASPQAIHNRPLPGPLLKEGGQKVGAWNAPYLKKCSR
jgi:hypothetical protein